MSFRLKAIRAVLISLLVLIALFGGWFYWRLRGSLPPLDGSIAVAGLKGTIRIERDHLGVPTLSGNSEADVVRALGFVHAQDRFFQMDLTRRRGAGELSELFGRKTLAFDRAASRHEFRRLAREVFQRARPDQQALLRAYAEGVNAGLASLRVKPFEYIVLGTDPRPWQPEDAILVSYGMLLTLQDSSARFAQDLSDVRSIYDQSAVDFFSPLVGPGDSALDGSTAPLPQVPSADVINLRRDTGEPASKTAVGRVVPHAQRSPSAFGDAFGVGSNAMAVAGRAGEPALLANDPHLTLTLPNTWYRASLAWPGHRIVGATLPGTPGVVIGSNGHIAWGMTNSCVATADLIAVTSDSPDFYFGHDGLVFPLRDRVETIHVKGHDDVGLTTQWTEWGPVVGHDARKATKLLVMRWTEDDPAATNCDLWDLQDAASVDQAIAIAHRAGIPAVNFLVADAQGQVGWTIAGRLPERVGYNGLARWPVSWQYGDRTWKGLLPPERVPVIVRNDYLWTANQRALGGDALALLGDGGYYRGARGNQVRDDLAALAKRGGARPTDLLGVQLDDRALFLSWWRDRILKLRTDDPDAAAHRSFYDAVERDSDRADIGSVGYRLLREFRQRVESLVLDPIFEPCADADPQFQWSRLNYEPAVRAILAEEPIHMLDPRWKNWRQLELSAVAEGARDVDGYTWGRRNRLRDLHPFGQLLPAFLTGWLNLDPVELPGDDDMPRVQRPSFGASERIVVAPGRESEGIFEMPGGQSGHPLSPYYRAGTTAWEKGEPSPFLPGTAEHVLLLQP
ncbi:MAG TPA: penicillin acylase family protein [Opitutaceae bacterium]